MYWIDLNIQLPKEKTDVLVWHQTNGCFMAQLIDHHFWLYYSDNGMQRIKEWQDESKINHWMPLPTYEY